ncbi:MAG TPA: hypothetical protein VGG09_10140 [Acidimicrobiales bacterium]|jgi:hypothetical protein
MRKWLVCPAAAAAAVIVLATAGNSGGVLRAEGGSPTAISASATTASGSSVLIAMGHLDDPSNMFWEFFFKSAGSKSWVLHTPPGVASNGGLVLAAAPSGSLTVGFLISADLKFSPVAQSTDGGDKWSPGELPSPLASMPDALAVGSSGEALALVATADQRVMETSGDLSAWRTLTLTKALRVAAGSCGVQDVTAVAYNDAAEPLLGLRCAQKGEVGLLAETAPSSDGPATWRDIGLSLGPGGGAAVVTRLVSTSNGVVGLGQVGAGKRTSIVAFWGGGSTDQWSGPTPFSVPAGWSVTATATGGNSGQGLAVLLGSGARRRVEVITGPGTSWMTLPPVPRDASGVSVDGAEVDTFVVTGSHLAVWAWTPGATGWTRTASMSVPVPYGSSS